MLHKLRRAMVNPERAHLIEEVAGTVLHKTHTPLHLWFWAAYLMSTPTPGLSAVQLQRQLGLSRVTETW